MSVPKEEIHRMIDDLPENKINQVKQYLKKLLEKKSIDEQWSEVLANPVYDDEPLTEEDMVAVKEALQDISEGRVESWEEFKRNNKI
ncbi:hypothetical protein Dtox_2459 [Desulfofarcimen acetoxidans DSM 771]|uniref:Uncharacterized protein n=1 Tax=Desulfofarcimen acetoxidans (strain ATCC 49208 / DSM 771 / KCTC 5769 / VKM B-1644 / 5575) TaxID=485916 RepID=C8W0L3_DESAS|nr:hypothetical protein [Desulfofarcimen acetoxidans]ACV63268.1 hypothetical protein Dtox_2459 [Desulfofarcimen acetoxidans DSM 771]